MSEHLLARKQSGRNTPPPLSPSISPSLSLLPPVIIVKERIGGVESRNLCVCVCPVVRARLYFSCQSEPHGAAADIRYNSLVYTRRLVMGLETKRGWMWNAGTQLYYNNELHRILGHGEGVGRIDRWMDGSKRGVVELTALF